MQAFMAKVPHQYQVEGKTVLPGESQVRYDKDWGYVLKREPQTLRQNLNFYPCNSRTIQHAGGNIEKNSTLVVGIGDISNSRLRKSAYAISFYRCPTTIL